MKDPIRFSHLRKGESLEVGSEIGRGSMFIRKISRSFSPSGTGGDLSDDKLLNAGCAGGHCRELGSSDRADFSSSSPISNRTRWSAALQLRRAFSSGPVASSSRSASTKRVRAAAGNCVARSAIIDSTAFSHASTSWRSASSSKTCSRHSSAPERTGAITSKLRTSGRRRTRMYHAAPAASA
jgi:hypothetical protein